MLNPSDPNQIIRAILADRAQLLRTAPVFGAVAYHESPEISAGDVHVEHGYADCLPILAGGCWRDPDSPVTMETMR